MIKTCAHCDRVIKTGELVDLMIVAHYKELASSITFSIEKPIDSYPASLKHHDCEATEVNGNV